MDKIAGIERELAGSIDLREVSKAQDVDEFEALTNREFNRNFEAALLESDQTVKPLIRSRRTRREISMGRPQFLLDESNVKTFTFRHRYTQNQQHGRNTSTITSKT